MGARETLFNTLRALAAPLPRARFVRRSLAQARQDLAQALLDAGQVEDARAAFDATLAERQKLFQEAPTDEVLHTDLIQSQFSTGDVLAAAGRLKEAGAAWEKGLADLEAERNANPNRFPLQVAFAERLAHVADQYGRVGLFAEALGHYRRAFAVQAPSGYWLVHWYQYAVLLVEAGATGDYQSFADRATNHPVVDDEADDRFQLSRILLVGPDPTPRRAGVLRRLAEQDGRSDPGWGRWIPGFARVRLGEAEKWLALLEAVGDPSLKWPSVALAQHQLGHRERARQALHEADLAADRAMQGILASDQNRLAEWWVDWCLCRVLRRQAHQAIEGKPLPDSPYDRLHHARVLQGLGQVEQAEAELAAAVRLRPDDAGVWLARARVFGRLGWKDRMAADLARARRLEGGEARPWVETGQMLAELGEPAQADAAYARASVLGLGELNRFLEAGWWVVGPYPARIDLACPPEIATDPSRPVAAVGDKRDLRWRIIPSGARAGNVPLAPASVGPGQGTYYAMAFVHADADRTAELFLRTADDARLWVNGRLVFEGFDAWGITKQENTRVPVTLRAGRNRLLLKVRHTNRADWFEALFHDSPNLQALDLFDLGLWNEAADGLAQADRRTPVDAWRSYIHMRCLLAAGRDDEYRRGFAEMIQRFDQTGVEQTPTQLAMACFLPPEKSPDRDRWVQRWEKQVGRSAKAWHEYQYLANAYFRAARFAEAERTLRQASALDDNVQTAALWASTAFYLGRTDEARTRLRAVEERYSGMVRAALKARTHRLPLPRAEGQAGFLILLREAQTLIDGRDPGVDPHEPALRARAQEWLGQLKGAEDHFARLVLEHPNWPRLWIDRGGRLGALGRWDEAGQAFARAVKLGPRSPQVWSERGRAYAALGKWDEAAADFVHALSLAPPPDEWLSLTVPVLDDVVRDEEVFARVARQMPKNRPLGIQRVHYLARNARWADAADAIAQVTTLNPADPLSWHFQATLHLQVGDLEALGRDCREMLERFGTTSDALVAQRIAIACLLAPRSAGKPVAGLLEVTRSVPDNAETGAWQAVTLGLGEYRTGEWSRAIDVLAGGGQKFGSFTRASFLAVKAMAQRAQNRWTEARRSLAEARHVMAQIAEPGPGEPQPTWFSWVQAQLLLREAESRIAEAPVAEEAAGTPLPAPPSRHARKHRADQASAQAALAVIRRELGQPEKAEAELAAVLAERE